MERKVLFVISEIDYADHIALAYLSAVAKEQGWQRALCLLAADDLRRAVARERPDVVAYSANVMGFDAICAAHREAREEHAFVSILGGPHATFSPETFAESGMDAYCVGEGEGAFGDFLDRVEHGRDFDDVANLITRRATNAVRPLVKNLDDLPFPDRDLTLSHSFLANTAKKTFYATRGCPYTCAYCCNNVYHELYRGRGPYVRRFSVERVIREIEYVKSRYRTEFVKFGDDCFALKADAWIEEFTEKYARRIGLPFNCFLRLDRADDALLSALKRAGCYSVHLSVDSTSKLVRDEVLKRNMRDIDLAGVLRKIRAHGIHTWVNYMLAAPRATLEDDLATIRLSREGRVTYPSYSTTVPMKGTDLYDYCVEHGWLDVATHRSDMTGCSRRSTLTAFEEKDRDVRYNIYLLGAIIAKLPFPLDRVAIRLIKRVPPNALFKRLRASVFRYYIEHRIFKVSGA